jgi:two-component system response regulator DegU
VDGKIRVIIADDHTLLREGLRKILEMEPDIEIVGEAVDGSDVVDKTMELQPDVVLMDVNMPNGGGLGATAIIKEKMPEVNIVVLTIHDDDEYIAELINAGAKGYIPKDVEPARVVEAVRSVYQGNPFIPPNLMNKLLKKLQNKASSDKDTANQGPDALTQRELEVLQLIVNGKSNREIADTLIISEKTVKNHVTNILRKLDLSDRTQAAVFAIRNGLVSAG